jgi:hypothetical protein
MAFLNLFKRKRTQNKGGNHLNDGLPEISKAMFIEDQDPLEKMEIVPGKKELRGIEEIYFFLQQDYESRGYNDALTNPDESYRTDNLRLLNKDLAILIQKVSTYYEDLLKEIDFHILSRGRAGLVDLVETLKTRKELVEDHLRKVSQIRYDMENNEGMTNRIILSYQRGFMRGLSALTMADILKKEI